MRTVLSAKSVTRMGTAMAAAAVILSGVLSAMPASAQDAAAAPAIDKAQQAKRRPSTYLTIFNNGYGDDNLPAAPADYEKMVKALSSEANFNAIMGKYTPERLEICKKYGVKMVVDLLVADHHVYKNPKAAEELCTKLRNDPTVVAYHLWADLFGKQGAGRERDIKNVHNWDPTHATYIGTYRNHGIGHLAQSDFVSYYDFAWKRGIQGNFPHLMGAWNQAKKFDNRLGRYVECDAGMAGKGNFNRSLFLQNTSIACGLRAVMWFIGQGQMDMKALTLTEAGKDAGKVNTWLKPMWSEIPKLGLPTVIYGTPVTKDYNGAAVPASDKPVYAPGLEGCAFPNDFWIQPVSGEFVMGVSKYDSGTEDVVYVANLNAYGEQDVKLKLGKPVKALMFVREAGKYEELKQAGGVIAFKLEPAGGAIIRFQ